MIKINSKTVLCIIVLILSTGLATAKIKAPKPVKPVLFRNLKIVVDHKKPGYVSAYYMKSQNRLWEKQIYSIKINPRLEKDVQIVFITEMKLKGHMVIIKNSNAKTYQLDLYTGKVRAVKN